MITGTHELSPLVSIVTPSLNRAGHLKGLLRSIDTQTYGNIQHIVVDGGSTDGSVDILKDHRRPGFRWISEPDEGVYDAVNKGLRMAEGDILCYLNTDDRYFPYTVSSVVRAFESLPEVDVLFGDLAAFDEEAQRGWINFYPPRVGPHLRRGGLISQPTAFWRAAAGRDTGDFDVTLGLAADIDYWLRMMSKFRARKVNEVLAYEGHHSQRLTSGRFAETRAHEELALIQERHRSSAGPRTRVLDRLMVALALGCWHRIDTLRFIWNEKWSRGGEPGRAWSGFRLHSRGAIDQGAMLKTLLPYLGRRHRTSVITASPVAAVTDPSP